MADIIPNITTSDIFSAAWSSMPPQFSSGIGLIITLGKAIGIVVLVYLCFLIIQSVVRIRQALRMKQIAQDVAEIKQKLSALIDKKSSKDKKSRD